MPSIRQFAEAVNRAAFDAKRYEKHVEDQRERQIREIDHVIEEIKIQLGKRYDAFLALLDPTEGVCVCGHGVHAHEDADGGTHECQLCPCLQYRDSTE